MPTTDGAARPMRADARRNVELILDAAVDCIARDPAVSLLDIAQAAGVGRVTLYSHFDSRAGLVEAVTDRAIRHTDELLEGLDLGGEPEGAMRRLVEATWDLSHRYGALVIAAQQTLPPQRFAELHVGLADRARQVLRRGRRSGAFRTDLPIGWQVTTIQAIVHGGSEAVHRGEVTARGGRRLVTTTVLAALAAPTR